jgi:hypothetical protein
MTRDRARFRFPVLLALAFASLVLGASPARSTCNNCFMVRWCTKTWYGWDCCSEWASWGPGGLFNTAEQANLAAWSHFWGNCRIGSGPVGDKPESEVNGVGGGTVDPLLHCGGFGPSGNDGFALAMADLENVNIGWSALAPTQVGSDSAFLHIRAVATLNGSPQDFGFVRYSDSGGGHFKLVGDFTPGGAAFSRVECYLSGTLVAMGPPRVNGSFGEVVTGAWPRDAGIACAAADSVFPTGINLGWVSPITFQITGGLSPTTCDSVRVHPIGATQGFAGLSSVTFRLKNMSPVDLNTLEYIDLSNATVPVASFVSLAGLASIMVLLGALHLRPARRSSFLPGDGPGPHPGPGT